MGLRLALSGKGGVDLMLVVVEPGGRAVDVILAAIPNAPIWPQLPKRGLREQMEIQYSEG